MVAEEQNEREDRRRAAGAPADRRVEQVREVRQASNVSPLRPGPDATNVNVAQRAPVRGAAVDVAPNYAALAVGKANQVLWFLCGILELLLGLRVILRVIGASAAAPFVRFIYDVTQPLAAPFLGMLPNLGAAGDPTAPGAATAVLEVPTLIGMVVYFLVFLLVTSLLRLLVSRPPRV